MILLQLLQHILSQLKDLDKKKTTEIVQFAKAEEKLARGCQ